MPEKFCFKSPGRLQDEELVLKISSLVPGEGVRPPLYDFDMVNATSGEVMGRLTLRASNSKEVTEFAGHVGGNVFEEFRGNSYMSRALRLVQGLALRHGLSPFYSTCDPDNWASRKCMERAGFVFWDRVKRPEGPRTLAIGGAEEKLRFLILPEFEAVQS